MESFWIYFVFAFSCVYVDQSNGQYGIPCPHMFKYEWEGSEWVGLVQVQSVPLGITMNIEIMLSTRAKLIPSVNPSNPSIYQVISLEWRPMLIFQSLM